jgi:hypothetical protein
VNLEAGEALSADARARPLGHASRNEAALARTRSLKRTVSAPLADIETEVTRGACSAADDNGTRRANHEVPPATDTPTANPSGAASATATNFDQPLRKTGSPRDPIQNIPLAPRGKDARGKRE